MQLSPKLDVQRWALEAERSKSVNPVGKGLGRSIVNGRMRQIIQKKCYNFRLATGDKRTASCISTRAATLLLVVDWYSQVLGAAVHQY